MTNSAQRTVAAARAVLAKAEADLQEERRRRTILCSCGKRHAIGKLHLLITTYYHEPHGCSGGDYRTESEWQFVCPTTKVRNRLLFDDWGLPYEQRQTLKAAEPSFKSIYRGLFASSETVYDGQGDWDKTPWTNNHYVDQHRERFELPAKTGEGLREKFRKALKERP